MLKYNIKLNDYTLNSFISQFPINPTRIRITQCKSSATCSTVAKLADT